MISYRLDIEEFVQKEIANDTVECNMILTFVTRLCNVINRLRKTFSFEVHHLYLRNYDFVRNQIERLKL